MSVNLKKFFHRYQFLKLELDETEDEAQKYITEFNKIFGRYIVDKNSEMWVNEETGEIRPDKPSDTPPKKKETKPEKIKKLYKKLSKFTHPDKGGSVEDFNEIKSAYESNNLLELIYFAGKYDIDVEIEEEDIVLLNSTCSNMEKEIDGFRSSPAWTFYNGNKNQRISILRMMEQALGIKIPEEDFPSFMLEDD